VNGVLNALVGNKRGAINEQGGVGAWAQEAALIQNDGKVMVLKANPMHDVLISRFSNVQSLVNINTPIVSINYSADPIVLTAKDGSTYQANKVIVTVPISQLKSNAIAFTPGLPGGITGSLAKFEMGASYRAVIEFKKNFWGDTIGYILGSGDVPEYFSIGVGRSQFNATLSVTVNGSKAAKYSAMKNDDAILAILADLDVLYAGQATKYVRQVLNTTTNIYVVEDWSKIAYIGGGYAYPLPGATSTDRKNLSAPVNNVLFFAGEATDVSGQAGTVNGALASAERCAQEVITSITKA
jgi:monoamine oxidase